MSIASRSAFTVGVGHVEAQQLGLLNGQLTDGCGDLAKVGGGDECPSD
jgi:hypothetical protein